GPRQLVMILRGERVFRKRFAARGLGSSPKDEENEKRPLTEISGRERTPAITYSRVRDTTIGPGCLTAVFGMGTGVAIRVCSPGSRWQGKSFHSPAFISIGSGKSCWSSLPDPDRRGTSGRPPRPGKRINAVKRSAVSTGRLSGLPRVHPRPIDLVVFQEPSALRQGDLVLKGVSRLDAFSVYPFRT